MIEILRQIEGKLGGDLIIKIELGNYKKSSLATLKEGQSRLVILKDDAFLTWVVDDGEWSEPQKLIDQVVAETPQMIAQYKHYKNNQGELLSELARKVGT